ncbi:MAG: hypothetical protein ACRC1J_05120 [Sandaracinobacteroides sp.]
MTMPTHLDDRIRIQVELALTSAAGCSKVRTMQDCAARAVGLSGAEIDAARDRRCFDRRARAAVALACALGSASTPAAELLASPFAIKARRDGLSDDEIEAIHAMAVPTLAATE